MDKSATGKQIAGHVKARKERRPYRAATLLNKTTATLPAPWSATDAQKVAAAAEALEKFPLIADDAVMAAMRYYISNKIKKPEVPKVKTAGIPDVLYSGSPSKVDELRNPGKGRGVFLTTQPGYAVPFVIKRQDVLGNNKSSQLRVGSEAWKSGEQGAEDIPTHVQVVHDSSKIGPKSGVSYGYLYKVDVSKIKDQLVQSKDEPREIVYQGTSIPLISRTPVTVKWDAVVGEIKHRAGTKPVKTAAVLGEFAPGIPISRRIQGIEKVKPDDPNPDWLLSISHHPAQRRGCVPPGTRIQMGDSSLRCIEEVVVGDRVAVPRGIATVTRTWDNGPCDEWLELTTTTRRLVCTGNHPLYVQELGWVPAEELVDFECEVQEDGKIEIRGFNRDVEEAQGEGGAPSSRSGMVDREVRGRTAFSGRDRRASRVLSVSSDVGISASGYSDSSGTGTIHSAVRREDLGGKQLALEGREVQREDCGMDGEWLPKTPTESRTDRQTRSPMRMVRGDKETSWCASHPTVPILPEPRREVPGSALSEVPHCSRRTVPGTGRETLRIRRLPRTIQSRLDLEIQDSHCFYAEGFLVHNSHLDLRLVDSKDRAHSWALPAELPRPGQNVYAVQQPTHTGEYARRTDPFELPPGYGATRPGAKVEPLFVGATEVMEAGKNKVRFLRHLGKETEEFVLRKIDTPDTTAGRMWVLHNATKNINTGEGKKIPLYKRDYATTEPEKLDLNDPSKVLTAKIDGAHTTLHLHGEDHVNRVYSYRQPAARETGLIEHTHKIPDFQKWRSPNDLKGTVLRTELWFAGADGKAIKSTDIGGILNSGTLRSREKQQELGVSPKFSVIDVVRFKGKNVEDRPFGEKLDMMREVAKKVSGIELPPMAFTPDQKQELFKAVKGGKLPETKEGFVERHLTAPGDKPLKAVIRPNHDVYVRDVFTEKGQRNMAAGFKYSWTPDGPIVGKVGTGLDHSTKKDMLKNPDDYIGRVALVRSMDASQNRSDPSQLGALRAPSFKGWHLDKNDPDKVKEAMESDVGLVQKLRQSEPGVDRVLGAASKLTEAAETMRPDRILEAAKEAVPALSRKARAVISIAQPAAEAVGIQLPPIDKMATKRPGAALMEQSVKIATVANRGRDA